MSLNRTVTLIVALVSALVLAVPSLAQNGTATPDVRPSDEFFNLNRYQGNGYTLLLPANATVSEPDASTTLVLGPSINIRPGDVDFQVQGNAYTLTITIEDNPQNLSAADFAAQAVEKAYADVVAEGGPTGGLPVTAGGSLDLAATSQTTVGGEPAFVVRYFSFDSTTPVIYVARGGKVYEFSYQENIVENQPIALVQQDIYALILATVAFAA